MKRIVIVSIIFSLLLSLIGCSQEPSEVLPDTATIGNRLCNITGKRWSNGERYRDIGVAENDEYIFFCLDDECAVYRYDKESGEVKVVSELDRVFFNGRLFLYDHYVCVYNYLGREFHIWDYENEVQLDDPFEDFSENPMNHCILMIDDWIYYTLQDSGIYRIRMDGTGKERLMRVKDLEDGDGESVYAVDPASNSLKMNTRIDMVNGSLTCNLYGSSKGEWQEDCFDYEDDRVAIREERIGSGYQDSKYEPIQIDLATGEETSLISQPATNYKVDGEEIYYISEDATTLILYDRNTGEEKTIITREEEELIVSAVLDDGAVLHSIKRTETGSDEWEKMYIVNLDGEIIYEQEFKNDEQFNDDSSNGIIFRSFHFTEDGVVVQDAE